MKVSVIISVWNRPVLLWRAVKSVLQQTYPLHELIIVDDGSTDNTPLEIQKILELDNLFAINAFILPHSGMPGVPRNYGIENATGDWIAFLDSDDEWSPTKIAEQIKQIEHHEVQWCHARERWIRNGKIISQKNHIHRREGIIFEDALKKCIIGPSSVLINRDLFKIYGRFREDLEIAEDYELFLRICGKEPIGYIDTPLLTKYAGHGNQLSEKYGFIEKFHIVALQGLIENQVFDYNTMVLAKKELEKKQAIWEQGARKRYLNERLQ